jgi:molybdate transport system substrate-binding protein
MRRFVAALLLVAAACGGGSSTAPKGDLLVFAAASLTEVFQTIGTDFERAHPGVHVRFNFGPSDGLATGIAEGGEADVFASAGSAPMDRLSSEPGLRSRAVFARNELVLIVPRRSGGAIGELADVVRPGVKLALAATGVPAGDYARQVLANAHLVPSSRTVVTNEADVKGVVQKVVLGEADAGIVYATDVTAAVANTVSVIAIPDAINVVASYPIAVIGSSKHRETAEAFVAYVLGPGRTVLRAAGFLPPA